MRQRTSWCSLMVSISQSSLGGSRLTAARPLPPVSARFQSRNRVWAVHATNCLQISKADNCFNLAIEFGRFTLCMPRLAHAHGSRVSISQSSLGGSRLAHPHPMTPGIRVSISQSSLGGSRAGNLLEAGPYNHCFNLAIEFGRFTPGWAGSRFYGHDCFNLAIEFGRFTPAGLPFPYTRAYCFNLAIEFGRFTRLIGAAISGIIAGFNLAIEFGRFTPRWRCPFPVPHHHAVSISQSSLGGSRCARRHRRPGARSCFNLAIEFGRFTPPTAARMDYPSHSFNLAIEFGRFTRCVFICTVQNSLMFQSRNRVWAVHASTSRSRRCRSALFQSRNRVWAVHAGASAATCRQPAGFQSRNRVWAVHARVQRQANSLHSGFNLAIEFGRFTQGIFDNVKAAIWVSISQSSLGGSRIAQPRHLIRRLRVSISQSSLGGSRHLATNGCLLNWDHGFNLAIEFGRFPLDSNSPRDLLYELVSISQSSLGGSRLLASSSPRATIRRFQSRNRVWAVHASNDLGGGAMDCEVSISQSSLGGSRRATGG